MLKKGGGLKSSTLKSLIQSGYDRSQVEGWTKVMDTPEVSAFKHNTTPQVVIVLRGTTGSMNDWSNNAVLVLAEKLLTSELQDINEQYQE